MKVNISSFNSVALISFSIVLVMLGFLIGSYFGRRLSEHEGKDKKAVREDYSLEIDGVPTQEDLKLTSKPRIKASTVRLSKERAGIVDPNSDQALLQNDLKNTSNLKLDSLENVSSLPAYQDNKVGQEKLIRTQEKSAPSGKIGINVKNKSIAKSEDNHKKKKETGKHRYTIQVGSFKTRTQANTEAVRFLRAGFKPFVELYKGAGGLWFRVRVGKFASKEEANMLAKKLRNLNPSVFITLWESEMDLGLEFD